jgi:hypothetical protein
MRGAVLAVLVAAACVAMPRVSAAANVGGEVFGAFNTHGMNDNNDGVSALNQGGANFDEIKSGLTGGIAVRVWPMGSWMLSAAWEPLFLESSDGVSGDSFSMDAQTYQATVGFFFPTMTPAKFGIAGGAGMYNIAGEATSGSVTSKIEGSGVGFHAMGMTEMTVSPGFAVTGALGWRWADIEMDNSGGQTADYSGAMARVGLAFYLPTP